MATTTEITKTCLLLLPESKKADTRDLDDLETNTGDITLSLTPATETGDEDLVVLVDEVQATIVLSQETQSDVKSQGNPTIRPRPPEIVRDWVDGHRDDDDRVKVKYARARKR